uniref:Uncharacterized protein n=1 Tax=viral metagenome TaxID=1070528 RepID=A0A6C0B081_9ZZZZ
MVNNQEDSIVQMQEKEEAQLYTQGGPIQKDYDEQIGGKRMYKNKNNKRKTFHYKNSHMCQHDNKKTIRHVIIKNGKGHKSISCYKGKKLVSTIKKKLSLHEINIIRSGKFIPGLFRNCKTKKHY